jgi:hypothetical protein
MINLNSGEMQLFCINLHILFKGLASHRSLQQQINAQSTYYDVCGPDSGRGLDQRCSTI